MTSSGVGYIVAVAVGALLAFFGQEFHLWREHRRRFDDVRYKAYTNLVTQAYRTYNHFVGAWSPFSLAHGPARKRFRELHDDTTAAIATARMVASEPVYQATVELMGAVEEAVTFATSVLAPEARWGVLGWPAFRYKPMPVVRHPDFQSVVDKLRRATDSFMTAAQEELKVPGKRHVPPKPPRSRRRWRFRRLLQRLGARIKRQSSRSGSSRSWQRIGLELPQ